MQYFLVWTGVQELAETEGGLYEEGARLDLHQD